MMWLLLACTEPGPEVDSETQTETVVDAAADTETYTETGADTGDEGFVLEAQVVLDPFLVLETNLPPWTSDCLAQDIGLCEDEDQDGLVDLWEDIALEAFHPMRVLDEDEPAHTDDAVLADIGRVAPIDGERVHLYIMLGWSVDYGRCGVSGHNGDSERVALDVRLQGPRAIVEQVYTAAHEGTVLDHGGVVDDLTTLSVSEEPRWQVFVSEGKHATYPSIEVCENVSFVPCVDEDCAPDGVAQPADYQRIPDIWNAGEEDHPRLSSLEVAGFPGDDAWADQEFCGGLDRGGSCSSAVREKLLNNPF